MAVAGEALHGFGSGSVVVAMRAVVSKFFLENELTFALVREREMGSYPCITHLLLLPAVGIFL